MENGGQPESRDGRGATESIQTHEQRIVLYGSVATRISKGQFRKKPISVSPTCRLQIEMVRLQGQWFAGVVLGLNSNTTVFSPNCALDEVLLKCCNITSNQVKFQLNHVSVDGAAGNANLIIFGRALPPGGVLDIIIPGMVASETIVGQSDTTNGVNVMVYGRKAER